jgi:hypothetical protein
MLKSQLRVQILSSLGTALNLGIHALLEVLKKLFEMLEIRIRLLDVRVESLNFCYHLLVLSDLIFLAILDGISDDDLTYGDLS